MKQANGILCASILLSGAIATSVLATGGKSPETMKIENSSGAVMRIRVDYTNGASGGGDLAVGATDWKANVVGGGKLSRLTVQSVKFDQSCPRGCVTRTWTSRNNPPSADFVEGIFKVVVEPTQIRSSFVRKSDGTLKEFVDTW